MGWGFKLGVFAVEVRPTGPHRGTYPAIQANSRPRRSCQDELSYTQIRIGVLFSNFVMCG